MNNTRNFDKQGMVGQWITVVIVVIVLLIGAYLYLQRGKVAKQTVEVPTGTEEDINGADTTEPKRVVNRTITIAPRVISVTAKNGVFTPNKFELGVLDPVSLAIEAVDKDYSFVVKDGGFNYTIKKGSVSEIAIGGLGSGAHTFTCGSGCSGTITLVSKNDNER
jgi:hypothetical protein